jgi:hypothetical protein
MSIIRQHLKQRLDRARISRYNRTVVSQDLRQRRASEHVERASVAGGMDYI